MKASSSETSVLLAIYTVSYPRRLKYSGIILQALFIDLDCLTLEDGTDKLSRNVGKKLPFYAV
jgi:hypothetical protein